MYSKIRMVSPLGTDVRLAPNSGARADIPRPSRWERSGHLESPIGGSVNPTPLGGTIRFASTESLFSQSHFRSRRYFGSFLLHLPLLALVLLLD